MKPVFGDTSYFLASLIRADLSHQAARRWASASRTPITISEYVVVEVANYLSPAPTRGLFRGFLRALRSDRRITIVAASSELLERGMDLYLARGDKAWSVTDCTSFVVMEEHGITEALPADRHFGQAGFAALQREPD